MHTCIHAYIHTYLFSKANRATNCCLYRIPKTLVERIPVEIPGGVGIKQAEQIKL